MPVRAGDQGLGVLMLRRPGAPFADDDVNLLAALAGQLAVALQKSGERAPASGICMLLQSSRSHHQTSAR